MSVGGIYTVLRTKAAVTVDELGEQYYMVGPYVEQFVRMEVEVCEPTHNEALMKTLQHMRNHGMKVYLQMLKVFPKWQMLNVDSGCLWEVAHWWMPQCYPLWYWIRSMQVKRMEEWTLGKFTHWNTLARSGIERCCHIWIFDCLAIGKGFLMFKSVIIRLMLWFL